MLLVKLIISCPYEMCITVRIFWEWKLDKDMESTFMSLKNVLQLVFVSPLISVVEMLWNACAIYKIILANIKLEYLLNNMEDFMIDDPLFQT